MLLGFRLAVPGARRELPPMPRRLDSVNQGGYVEAIDVADSELEAVIGMLSITDARRLEVARDRIYAALEDLKTATARTVKAKPVDDDLRDLSELAKVASPEAMTAPINQAINALESMRTSNPVLHQRLKSLLHGRKLRELIAALKDADEAVFVIGREIDTQLSALADEVRSEDRRGRPTDWACLRSCRRRSQRPSARPPGRR